MTRSTLHWIRLNGADFCVEVRTDRTGTRIYANDELNGYRPGDDLTDVLDERDEIIAAHEAEVEAEEAGEYAEWLEHNEWRIM